MLINDYTLPLQNINSLHSGHRAPFSTLQSGFKEKKTHAHLWSNCIETWSNLFSYNHLEQTPSSHTSDQQHKWRVKANTEVKAICVFWKRHDSTAQRLGCIPWVWPLTVLTTRSRTPECPGSLLRHRLGTAVHLPQHSALDPCLTHMAVLKSCKTMEHGAKSCTSAALLGRMAKLPRAGAARQQPFGAQSLKSSTALKATGEHFMFLSTICWYLGHWHSHSHLLEELSSWDSSLRGKDQGFLLPSCWAASSPISAVPRQCLTRASCRPMKPRPFRGNIHKGDNSRDL